MRKPSGDLHIVDYKTKRVIVTLQPEDYIEDSRHWEIKNNADILDFKLLEDSPYAVYLQQQNLVLKEVRSGVIVPYVITEIEKDSASPTITVYASGEWILLDKDNYLVPQRIESWTANKYLEFTTARTEWLVGNIEAKGTRTHEIKEFTSPLKLIQEVAALFDNMEIQYRIIMQGNKIAKKYIDLVEKRGTETGKEVTLGKDLLGVKRIENSDNIITALVPFVMGQDADGNEKIITIESVNNGLQYIVDEDAYQHWNVNGKHLFGFYTPETEEQNMTPERLLTLAKIELKKRVKTIVTYEVDAVDVSRVLGWDHEQINEGDTINIIDEGMNPTLYLEARAIAGDESYKDPRQNKYTFGNYREIIDQDEALRKLYQKMLTMIQDKVSKEWFDALEEKVTETNTKVDTAVKESQTAKDLAEATKDYMEQNMVDIIEQPTAPTENLRDGKTLWIDSSDPENKVQKLWKDGQWQRVTPDTGPLQQSITDAENEINTLKETVKYLPDTTWVNQQLEGKADKSGVYTKEYIDQNVVGKQVYETDKQGNIQTFTDLRTDVDRNAQEITNKAEKTVVNQLSDGLADVSQIANTAKQTAEGNTQVISELDTKVSNIKVDVRNRVINSTFNNGRNDWTGGNSFEVLDPESDKPKSAILHIEQSGATGDTLQQLWSNPFKADCDGTKEFTISFDYFTPSIGNIDAAKMLFCIRTFDDTTSTGQAQSKFYKNIYITDIPMLQDGKWIRYSVTVKPPAGTYFRVAPYLSRNGSHYWREIMVTEGNKEVGWSPAPEDMTDNFEFTKKTNEIINTVDTNSQTITVLQKDQGTMQTTLNQVKQTTDSNSQTITTLTQTQGEQGEIIQQNTSDITQLNNQIKSTVTDTQMQEYVGGLGSTNVLFNAAFEDRVINASTGIVTSRTPSLSKWTQYATGAGRTITVDSARNHDGYNSVKLSATGLSANNWMSVSQTLPIKGGSGNYVLSAWFYTDDLTPLDQGCYLEIGFYNGSTRVLNKLTEARPLMTAGAWKFVSVVLDAPPSGITSIKGHITLRRNGNVWVSQPQLQQGTTPSSFMENPKDYANYDQLVGEIAKKVATSEFDSKVSTLETSITQQSNRIDLKAEKTDVYSKIDADGRFGSKAIVDEHTSQLSLMSDEINLRVKNNEIASTINQTAQSVLIQAQKIMLDGYIEAKHLKAQDLVGVTIKTAPNTEDRYIKLNRQFLEMYDKNVSRVQLRFFNSSSANSINPSLVMGRSNTKGIVGAATWHHFTFVDANGNETGASSQSAIGIVNNYNETTNLFGFASQIRFFETGAINIHGEDTIWIKGTKNGHINIVTDSVGSTQPIYIEPSSYLEVTAGTGIFMTAGTSHNFKGNGTFNFSRSGAPAEQNQMMLTDDGNNADLRLAFIRLRSSHVSGYQGKLQLIPTGGNTPTAGLEAGNISYTSLTNRSSRATKANIRDLEIDSLEKIMGLKVQQYNFKSDVEKLYQMREEAVGTEKVYTTADIPLQYGLVLEDTDKTFHSDLGDGINLYTLVSLNVDGTQKIKRKQDVQDEKISQLEKELEEQKLKEVDQDKRIAALEELVGKLMNETPTTENTTQTERP
ncbi:phage tail spike protein [Bacillus bingmayongensis]|uniref:phage tail spike protein n=1 Tax=Bacillus bingmayongensis TaxID=1150157 RepID=UPI001C8ED6AE|nr:phage tail spike protein [Bacillus bingmayongensis]MBY0597681.1 peptidase S74 [Bacillus bingmayongensis]